MARGKRGGWRSRALVVAVLVLLVSCALLRKDPRTPPAIVEKAPGAARIGSTACLECHDVRAAMKGSVHGPLALDGSPGSRLCETCHGAGGVHAASYDPGDIFNAQDLARLGNAERSAVCLSCHETMATRWIGAPHEDGEISCWSCHPDALHGWKDEVEIEPPQLRAGPDGGRFCFQCHGEVEQEFLGQVSHPVTAGRMECSSCHTVHGGQGLLEGGEDETCTRCHVEVAGPWIYEHDAMSEGCTSCHAPHGSPNPKLLVLPGSGLCLQCHLEAAFPTLGGSNHGLYVGGGATCYQCHFEVHGSNTSEVLAPGSW
jgi:DmsE family decaheme c-type cytochrome